MQDNRKEFLVSYGRRHGRPLKEHHAQLMAEYLPEIKVELPEKGMFLAHTLFPDKKELWLEIGFGGGEHLAAQAAQHPDIGFIGSEVYENGVAKCLATCVERGLNNVRVYNEDVRMLLLSLPEGSLNRIYILFPDPWPKKKHHKRRLISGKLPDMLARVLQKDGELRIATDSMAYAQWILVHMLQQNRLFTWEAKTPQDWTDPFDGHVTTRYEAKAREKGDIPCFLKFRRNH